MGWTVFEIFINTVQAFMFLFFMHNRLHIKKPHLIVDVICVLAITCFFSAYLFVDMSIPDILGFVFLFLFALCVAEDRWYISAYWVIVLAILVLSTINLSIHIFMTIPDIPYDVLMEGGIGRILFIIVTNALIFLIIFSASKLKREYTKLNWSVFLLFLLMNGSIFAVEEALFSLQMDLAQNEQISTIPFFLAYVGLCLCTYFSILLFHMMTLSTGRENLYRAEINSLTLLNQHQQELESVYENLCAQRHDFKQHFQALEEMVRLGNSQEAESYLLSYQNSLSDKRVFITGCSAVDALLTAKFLTMSKLGITLRYVPYPLNELPISTPDFCAIVGNLLDNAIEGVQRISSDRPKLIHLTFSRTWNMFYIHCTNPCDPKTIRRSKGVWLSSKEAEGKPGLHAIGIRNIKKITKHAEGRCSFATEGFQFKVQIVLPFPFDLCKGV